jgi:hypothetical protein
MFLSVCASRRASPAPAADASGYGPAGMSRSARVRRLRWAVGIFGAIAAGIVALVLGRLWTSADPNVAGWVTTVVAYGAAYAAWEMFELSGAFRRSSGRTQRVVIAAALALAIGGGVFYVLVPGPVTWYLAALPVIPAFLILMSFPDSGEESSTGDFGDGGPWTAP